MSRSLPGTLAHMYHLVDITIPAHSKCLTAIIYVSLLPVNVSLFRPVVMPVLLCFHVIDMSRYLLNELIIPHCNNYWNYMYRGIAQAEAVSTQFNPLLWPKRHSDLKTISFSFSTYGNPQIFLHHPSSQEEITGEGSCGENKKWFLGQKMC